MEDSIYQISQVGPMIRSWAKNQPVPPPIIRTVAFGLMSFKKGSCEFTMDLSSLVWIFVSCEIVGLWGRWSTFEISAESEDDYNLKTGFRILPRLIHILKQFSITPITSGKRDLNFFAANFPNSGVTNAKRV